MSGEGRHSVSRPNITRTSRVAGAVLAALIATMVSTVPADAATAATSKPRPLAVSVPAEPAPLRPGMTGTIPIRVVNPGTAPLSVRLTGRRVMFGDDGRITIAGRDPLWDGRVDFPVGTITIPAGRYRNIGLVVRMPARIEPDLYFIGFLVTPAANDPGSVTYINQIGSYVTIDVPGPRNRALAAELHLAGFAFTTHTHAQLHLHNVGTAAAVYWGESDTTSAPGGVTSQHRLDRSLLPQGRSRTSLLDVTPSFPIAIVTIHVHIIYPGRTDATTTELVVSKRVLIVQPAAFILLIALLVAAAGVWYAFRRRRRQGPRQPNAQRSTPARRNMTKRPSSKEREATHVIRALEQRLAGRGRA